MKKLIKESEPTWEDYYYNEPLVPCVTDYLEEFLDDEYGDIEALVVEYHPDFAWVWK